MFDFPHPPATPKISALKFVARSRARLVLAASRIGGENGMALAHALTDMILDEAVDPLHWPLEEMIGLLRTPRVRDAQVERLVEQLEDLRRRADCWEDDRS